MPTTLDAAYLAALAAASPFLALRSLRTGRYRRHLASKIFGRVELPDDVPTPRAWFHAVSVGEVHLLRTLVPAFRERFPRWQVVVSSSTDTGLAEARRIFTDLPVIAFPLDFSWAVGEALDHVRPGLLVLAEGELWPGLLRAAERRGVPVVVVNGRMSPRSAARYRRLGWLARPMLRRVARFAVQTDDHAEHLRGLGVPAERVTVTGSIKYDGVTGDRDDARVAAFRDLFAVRPGETVWVAGSTQAPEEEQALGIVARLRRPDVRLVLVPRHRERFDAVAGLCERSGLRWVRRSAVTSPADAAGRVVLVDTIGELSAVWGLADLAFVGGSLDGRRGGQNMIEPAVYGAAVLFGPHVWNFRHTVDHLLAAGGAVQVAAAAALESTVTRLLDDPHERRTLGERARRFVQSQQGATQRTLDALTVFVQE